MVRSEPRHKGKKISVFTGAAGTGGIGGVIFKENGALLYLKDVLGEAFVKKFNRRKTNIIPLELMAVVVTAKRFARDLSGADVIFYIDNQSVKYSLRKGRCKAEDVNRLVTILADVLTTLNCKVKFRYVPSSWNVADFPSRSVGIYEALEVSASKTIRDVIGML